MMGFTVAQNLASVAPLNDDARAQYIQKAWAALEDNFGKDWMLDVLTDAINTPSPTGQERPGAEFFARVMAEHGLVTEIQPIVDESANVVGQLGAGPGASVLIFAPLDSATTGVPDEEVPWVGSTLTPEHQPTAVRDGDRITGLAANNSKAHIVASIAAAAAIAKAGVPLCGRVLIGLGAGGAPVLDRPAIGRFNVGLGVGCEHMLRQGVRTDFAIVTKPGYSVQWEEAGLCWFRIRVHGVQSYAGRKHLVPNQNPILAAAGLIPLLERWLQEYSRANSDGLITPQGVVGALRAGWSDKPAFTPAACDIFLDLRITPRQTPLQVWRALNQMLSDVVPSLSVRASKVECKLIAAVDGPATDEQNWIVQAGIRAWEEVEQTKHTPDRETSGQTEAVILRRYGIPTARIGLPEHVLPSGERTMGVAYGPSMVRLAKVLIHMLVDTCTRDAPQNIQT